MKSFWIGILGVAIGLFFADIAAEVAWRNARSPYSPPYKTVPPPVDGTAGDAKPQVKAQDSHENTGDTIATNKPASPDPRKDQSDAFNQQGVEQLKVDREANEIAAEGNKFSARDNEIQAQLVIVGLATIVSQIILTGVQICFIRAANRYAGSAARAAQKSARSALTQTKVMENQMRPWMMVTPGGPDGGWPVGGAAPPEYRFPFKFKWTAKNVGSGLAFLTRLSVKSKIVDWPIPDECPPYPEVGAFAKFPIPPNGIHEGRERVNLTPLEIDGFLNGRKALVFYGIIDYQDTFGGSHQTRFYSFWGGENGMKIFSPVGPPKTIEYT